MTDTHMELRQNVTWAKDHDRAWLDVSVALLADLLADRDRLAEKVAFQAKQISTIWDGDGEE